MGTRWAGPGNTLLHTECVDWETRAFPFEWELARMRKQFVALREAAKALTQAGRWMRQLRARWPRGAARGVEEWLELKERTEAAVRRALGKE